MNKTITVKGVGSVSVKPDHVVISMGLETLQREYEQAMTLASEHIAGLTDCFAEAGFAEDSLKTSGFRVRTDYESVCRRDGSYEQVFRGYVVEHDLKIEFELEPDRLSAALAAVGRSAAHPAVSIRFTVRDAAAVNEAMLRAAAENARRKAEILCEASNRKLGELMEIDYNWGELNLWSNTDYAMEEKCLALPAVGAGFRMEPEEIRAQDTAAFTWEII